MLPSSQNQPLSAFVKGCQFDITCPHFDITCPLTDSVELVCHGIDTIADIHLNGALLFRADNMHRTWRTGVKAALHPGENAIRVCFHSAAEYAERLERENPVYKTSDTVDGFEQVRKAHCMYGWDWGVSHS